MHYGYSNRIIQRDKSDQKADRQMKISVANSATKSKRPIWTGWRLGRSAKKKGTRRAPRTRFDETRSVHFFLCSPVNSGKALASSTVFAVLHLLNVLGTISSSHHVAPLLFNMDVRKITVKAYFLNKISISLGGNITAPKKFRFIEAHEASIKKYNKFNSLNFQGV